MEYYVPACSVKRVDVKAGQRITVADAADRWQTSLRCLPQTERNFFPLQLRLTATNL